VKRNRRLTPRETLLEKLRERSPRLAMLLAQLDDDEFHYYVMRLRRLLREGMKN
jgi:hypothetical protein